MRACPAWIEGTAAREGSLTRQNRGMGREDWYRGPAWDAKSRADFEARLARSRGDTSRPQYLRIKALGLRDAGLLDEAAGLLDRSIEAAGDSELLRSEALHDLALVRHRQGRDAEAAELLRGSIEVSGRTEVARLIELLGILVDGDDSALSDAGRLIEQIEAASSGLLLPTWVFDYHIALIRYSERTGDLSEVPRLAAAALRIAGLPSPFKRHGDMGTVQIDDLQRRHLERLAAG
jgi:hypothetical protein